MRRTRTLTALSKSFLNLAMTRTVYLRHQPGSPPWKSRCQARHLQTLRYIILNQFTEHGLKHGTKNQNVTFLSRCCIGILCRILAMPCANHQQNDMSNHKSVVRTTNLWLDAKNNICKECRTSKQRIKNRRTTAY